MLDQKQRHLARKIAVRATLNESLNLRHVVNV